MRVYAVGSGSGKAPIRFAPMNFNFPRVLYITGIVLSTWLSSECFNSN